MSVKVYRGGAAKVAQVKRATPVEVEVGDVFTATIPDSGKSFSVTATSGTAAHVVDLLLANWPTHIPEFNEIIPEDGGDYLDMTARTAGKPFLINFSSSGDGGVNEVNVVTISSDTTAGNITLTISDGTNTETTGNIAFDADTATVQAAILALTFLTSGDCVVSGSAGDYTLTWGGNMASTNMTVTANNVDLAGNDSEWSVAFLDTPSGGGYDIGIKIDGVTKFATVDYDDNAAAITAACVAQMSFILDGDLVVTGGPPWSTPLTFTFGGNLADTEIEAVTINTSNLTGLTVSASVSTTQAGGGGLSADPAAYWKLNESSGNAVDSVGSLALTDTNTVTSAAGLVGTARQFTKANSERLTRASHASIEFTAAVSVDAFFRLDTLPSASAQMCVVSKAGGSLATNAWQIVVTDADLISCTVWGDGDTVSLTATEFGALSVDTWYHAMVVADGESVSLYVNGELASTSVFAAELKVGTTLTIGSFANTTTGLFDGRIDEVGIWGAALTATDAATRYASGSGSTYPFSGVNTIQTITVTGSPSTGDFIADAGSGSTTFDYNEAAATAEAKLEVIYGSGNVDVTGGPLPGDDLVVEFIGDLTETNVAELVIDDSGLLYTSTETTEGGAGGVNVSTAPQGSAGDSITVTTVTANSGPNDISVAANWHDGDGGTVALPTAGDTLIVPAGSSAMLYNLDAFSSVGTLAKIEFQGAADVGLPEYTSSGYRQYLPTYLAVDCSEIVINCDSGRIKLDTQAVQTSITVIETGSGGDTPAVVWKGTHADNAVTLVEGEFGASVYATESSTITLTQYGGSFTAGADCTLKSPTKYAGEWSIDTATVSGTLTDLAV